MTRGLYLSRNDAEALAEHISLETGLTTNIFDYEEKYNWFYVIVYDEAGHIVAAVDTPEDAEELIEVYKDA